MNSCGHLEPLAAIPHRRGICGVSMETLIHCEGDNAMLNWLCLDGLTQDKATMTQIQSSGVKLEWYGPQSCRDPFGMEPLHPRRMSSK